MTAFMYDEEERRESDARWYCEDAIKRARETYKRFCPLSRYREADLFGCHMDDANTLAVHAGQVAVESGESLYLFGEVGTGKTYLAFAFARALLEAFIDDRRTDDLERCEQWRCLFEPNLVDEVRASWGGSAESPSSLSVLERYGRCSFLIIDDLLLNADKERGSGRYTYLDRVVDARYSNRVQTVFTSNWSLKQIDERFDLQHVTDRIFEMCDYGNLVVELTGPSRRRREAS